MMDRAAAGLKTFDGTDLYAAMRDLWNKPQFTDCFSSSKSKEECFYRCTPHKSDEMVARQ